MSAGPPIFTVNDLAGLAPRWDKLIAADLIREVEQDISERVETISEMRLFLAIKGYRQLHERLTVETHAKTGVAALKAMAAASRSYAKERPGLSAATFRSPIVDSPEWMDAFLAVRKLFERAFEECGLDEITGDHALRILRSLVRGFVINEMSVPYSVLADFDKSFELAVDMFLEGLPALARMTRRDELLNVAAHCECRHPGSTTPCDVFSSKMTGFVLPELRQ
jgi:hypothetical protein